MSDNELILSEEEKESTTKIDWKRKLTSRKFWIATCSFVTLILIACGKTEAEAKQVAAIIMAGAVALGYILGEGLTDVAGVQANNEEYFDAEDVE